MTTFSAIDYWHKPLALGSEQYSIIVQYFLDVMFCSPQSMIGPGAVLGQHIIKEVAQPVIRSHIYF